MADKTSGQILTMRYAEYLLDVDPEAALKLLQGIPCVDCGYTFDPTRRTPCSSYRSGLHRWDSRESRFPGDKIEEVDAPLPRRREVLLDREATELRKLLSEAIEWARTPSPIAGIPFTEFLDRASAACGRNCTGKAAREWLAKIGEENPDRAVAEKRPRTWTA